VATVEVPVGAQRLNVPTQRLVVFGRPIRKRVHLCPEPPADLELALIGQHAQLAKQSRTSTESARTK